MTELPPPTPPLPDESVPWWRVPRNLWIVAGVVAVVILGAIGANKKKAEEDAAPSASDQRIEALRLTWNGMSAAEQHDLCSAVHLQGADVVADEVQSSAGIFGSDAHDDVVWFLEEMACD